MSHLPQRKEKNCLNCGTTVIGKYCHVCGQENIEPKESVWHLVSHFFSDITHFDGKFFTSVKDIILKPGFLSKEYMVGKRVSYLNPIRMYLFTSFIFFLIMFSLFKIDKNYVSNQLNNPNIGKPDSAESKELSTEIDNGVPFTKEHLGKRYDSTASWFGAEKYKSRKEYDSLLKAGIVKDNWVEKLFIHKGIELNDKYRNNSTAGIVDIITKVEHSIPQMLFVLLPLFALLLKLLYIRRKDFYYADHAIFTIHFYIFTFLAMLLIFGSLKINSLTGATWISFINFFLVLGIFFYLYKAMRNFYMQSRGKTILKYFLLLTSFTSLFAIVFVALILISFFEI